MKTAQLHFETSFDNNIRNVPETVNARQKLYIDRPSVTTSGAERLGTDSYSYLVSHNVDPLSVVEVCQAQYLLMSMAYQLLIRFTV